MKNNFCVRPFMALIYIFFDYLRCRKAFISCQLVPLLASTFSSLLILGSLNQPASKLSGALWRQGGKRKESLQLHLQNLHSTSNSPVAPPQLSCQISANQREAEMSVNVKKNIEKHVPLGNDVITNVISANQRFALTFLVQIFKFQRCSCKLPFLFPSPPPQPQRACSQAIF